MNLPASSTEQQRLDALRSYAILDTPREESFDDITRLVAEICEAPIALVSFVAEGRQWFKSETGLGASGTARDVSICAHAIQQEGLFVVPDTLLDDRFRDNPLVTGEPHIRFYAGAVLRSKDGHALGSLCVLDRRPRELTELQERTLRLMGRQVMTQLELHRTVAESERHLQQKEQLLREMNHRVKNSLQLISSLLSLQGATIKDPTVRRHLVEARNRVLTVALVHERLYQAESMDRVEFARYLRGLCEDLARSLGADSDGRSLIVEAEQADLPVERVIPLAMIVNELVTNAWKYAYPEGAPGTVTVRFKTKGTDLRLSVEDAGVGVPEGFDPAASGTFGMGLVNALVQQLGAELKIRQSKKGACFEVVLPITPES